MSRDFDSPEYKAWRKKVYARDRYRCQMPGCTLPQGGKLEAHHIRRWADAIHLRFVVSNGITLCEVCHEMVNGREDNCVDMFMRLVGRKREQGPGPSQSMSTLALMALMESRRRELPGSS